MKYVLSTLLVLLLSAAATAAAEEQVTEASDDTVGDESAENVEETPEPVDPDAPKLMSGMSILGNEEAPKSLVIIPWKSSEIGDDLGLSDSFDDNARPVDKEVFLRELAFYKIRSGN